MFCIWNLYNIVMKIEKYVKHYQEHCNQTFKLFVTMKKIPGTNY
jgi:hypothetical protein